MRVKQSGFTIIEVVILVIVLAILGVLGYVAYNQFIHKAQQAPANKDTTSSAQPVMNEKLANGLQTYVQNFYGEYASYHSVDDTTPYKQTALEKYATASAQQSFMKSEKECIQNDPASVSVESEMISSSPYKVLVKYNYLSSDDGPLYNVSVIKDGDSYKIDGIACVK